MHLVRLFVCISAVTLMCATFVGCAPTSARAGSSSGSHSKAAVADFTTVKEKHHIWVYRTGSEAHTKFVASGSHPGKFHNMVGAGPAGENLHAVNNDIFTEYLTYRPGFHSKVLDDKLWIVENGSKFHHEIAQGTAPGKYTNIIGMGPFGENIYTDNYNTWIRYQTIRPGFNVHIDGNNLWVFKTGSASEQEYLTHGPLSKHANLVGAGPDGMNVYSDKSKHIDEWLVAAPGFATYLHDDEIWVFTPGSEKHLAFQNHGAPGKYHNAVGAGPMGYNVYSNDTDALDGYLYFVFQQLN